MKTVIILGGSTLGHVIPGIAVGRKIRNKYPMVKIIYITVSKQKDLEVLKKSRFDKNIFININSLNRIEEIKMFFKLKKEFNQIYLKYRPNIVIGFGSFLGSVGILEAQRMKIKTIIHEQNAVMGLGNKICKIRCQKLLLNYKLKKNYKNSVIVGNPNLVELERLDIRKDDKKLVIVGGSNGASFLNQIMIAFLNHEYSNNFDITFITGKKYYDDISKKVKEKEHLKVVPFIDNLSNYLKDTKYIITRAGATTLSEIKSLNILPIIIPSPNVSNNHQYFNAIQEEGIVIEEKDLNVDNLIKALKKLENIKIINKYTNASLSFIKEINNVERLY